MTSRAPSGLKHGPNTKLPVDVGQRFSKCHLLCTRIAGKGAAVGVDGAERTAGVGDDARVVPVVRATVRGRQKEASGESRLQTRTQNNNRR